MTCDGDALFPPPFIAERQRKSLITVVAACVEIQVNLIQVNLVALCTNIAAF